MNPIQSTKIRELLNAGMEEKQPVEQLKKDFNSMPNPSDYMGDVLKWVPDSDYVHNLLRRTIRPYVGESGNVLDVGAGNGRLSKLILDAFSTCHITLLDVSASLLSAAPNKLKAFPGQYETVQGDCFDPTLSFPSASFDCAVSSFAICHGREEADYRHLYNKIYDWLKPESCFICLDHVYGATTELTALGFEDWGDMLARNFGEERASRIIKNAIWEDSPLPVGTHSILMSQAGFDAADVLWKKNVFALYVGLKRSQVKK